MSSLSCSADLESKDFRHEPPPHIHPRRVISGNRSIPAMRSVGIVPGTLPVAYKFSLFNMSFIQRVTGTKWEIAFQMHPEAAFVISLSFCANACFWNFYCYLKAIFKSKFVVIRYRPHQYTGPGKAISHWGFNCRGLVNGSAGFRN